MATATCESIESKSIGQLVSERPERARIFESFGIDYCCGGRKPLEQACAEKGVSVQTVVRLLEAFDFAADGSQRPRSWSDATMTELCDHIEQKHHAYLKQELPRLAAMLEKIASKHGPGNHKLIELRDVFVAFKIELEQHMFKEEHILFPVCRRLDDAGPNDPVPDFHCGSVDNPIRVMVQEHDDAGAALLRMRSLTDGYQAPADACNTYRAAFQSLMALELDMHEHVHKENSILFPKAVEAETRLAKGE